MKAVQINQYGGNDVVVLNDVTVPVPGEGQVLVKVRTAGVNPSDWKIRQGMFKTWVKLSLPATLGGDFAGIVEVVGTGVTRFHVGDEVYGRAGSARGGTGSFAEYIACDEGLVSRKPQNCDFQTAAALPLAGVSAWQALVEHIGLKARQRILIHGGAGGIGSLAIQIAKHIGAYVVATAAGEDMEFVKSLGADEVIDYKTQKFEQMAKDMYAVFDTVGGNTFERSFAVLKSGGLLVTMSHPGTKDYPRQDVRVVGQLTDVNIERLQAVTKLVEQGALNIHIDKVFPLEQAAEALEYQEHGKPRGKIVLSVV